MAEVLPLYILLWVMRKKFRSKDLDGAVALAKVSAPYLHGKAVLARVAGDLAEISDEELEQAGWDYNENELSGGNGETAEEDGTEEPW